MARITAFQGTTRVAGLVADYAPILPPPGGVPFFLERLTRQVFGFQPWLWMAMGWLPTPSILVTGGKGGGKTAALKLLLLTLMMLSMDGRRCRALIDNQKNNDGTSELEVPLKIYGDRATEIPFRNFGINVLDHLLGLNETQMLRLVMSLLVDLTENPLSPWQAAAIKEALRRLVEHDAEHANIALLVQVTARLSYEDVAAVYDRSRDELKQQLKLGHHLSPQLVRDLHRPLVIEHDRVAIEQGIAQAANLLQNVLLEGPEGNIFGNNSLARAFGDYELVSADLTGLSDLGATLVHGIMNHVNTADNARKVPRFGWDIIGQDEVYMSWRFKTFAHSESDAEWQLRDRNPLKVRIVQQIESYDTVGSVGSQEREMAMNSVNGAGQHWIFGGQSKASYKRLQTMLDFSDMDRRIARRQPSGCLIIKPQNRPALLAQIPLMTDLAHDVVRSNDSMRRRISNKRGRTDNPVSALLREGLVRAA